MKRAVLIVMSLMLVCLVSLAQKPAVVTDKEAGWHKIGEVTASFKMQNESIVVLGADKFVSLRLKVTDAPINIEGVQVFYEDGTMEELKIREQLEAGAQTRVLPLKKLGEIGKVNFTYRSLPSYTGDKAKVELYGLKSGIEKKSDSYREDMNKAEENAEDKADSAGGDVKRGVSKAGNKISEAASNTAAHVKDKVYDGKTGPGGETVYIDKDSKYYYINNSGKKVYITKLQLKDKD